MHPTESGPFETKLQNPRDPDHTIRGVGADGLFCCPECGAKLRIEDGPEFDGEGRSTLPGMPSSSATLENRGSEENTDTPVADPQALEASSAYASPGYVAPSSAYSSAAPHGASHPYASSTQYYGQDPGELPRLIEDPSELAPADTDEPTRVTRTHGLVELPPLPVLPPPPPLVAEEIARRASLGLPLPVLPPPPVAPIAQVVPIEPNATLVSAEGANEAEVEDIDALLASQSSPSHGMAVTGRSATDSQTDAAAGAAAAEKKAKHPLPVPHPVFVSVAHRRDATATPLAATPAISADAPPPVALPPVAPAPQPPEDPTLRQPAQQASSNPPERENGVEQAAPTQPSTDLETASAPVPVSPSAVELQVVPALPQEPAAVAVQEDGQHQRPMFSDAPLTRDAATIPPRRARSSRALWLGLLAVGAGAFVLQQRMRSSDTRITSTASPVVSVVLAAQPAVAMPDRAQSAAEPAASEPKAAESAEPELAAVHVAARLKSGATASKDPVRVASDKSVRTPEQPERTEAPKEAPKEDSEKAKSAEEPSFDADAAADALESAAASASSCRQPSDPSGVAVVTITFAPSGRVTTANISGPPFVGTATGSCIAATLRRAKVPAFKGNLVTVRKTVTIH